MSLRVAVLGAGKAGRLHAEAYARLPGARVTVVADPARTAETLAAEIGARWLADYRTLSGRDLDAVSICLPHHLLAPAAMWAAEAGLPALLEKPMALDLPTADRIVALFRTRGVQLMIGFVHRFRAEQRAAWQLIREGYIGDPVLAVDVKAYGVQNTPDWVWHKRLGGGVLLYNGIHGLDRLLWLTGRPAREVSAAAGTFTHEADVEDNLVGHVHFEGGSLGNVLLHLSPFAMTGHWTTTIYGSRGAIEIRTGHGFLAWGSSGDRSMAVEGDDRFALQLAEFIAAIVEEREPEVRGEHGRDALALALGLLDAAASGAPVALS